MLIFRGVISYSPEVEHVAPERWWERKTILSYWVSITFEGEHTSGGYVFLGKEDRQFHRYKGFKNKLESMKKENRKQLQITSGLSKYLAKHHKTYSTF